MKYLSSLLAIALILPALHVRADDDSAKRSAAAEKLLSAMHSEAILAQQTEAFKQAAVKLIPPTLPTDIQKKAISLQQVAIAPIFKQLDWENIKPGLVKIYSDAFSIDDLNQLISFYNSPVGQKFVSKMPEIQKESATYMKSKIITVVPEVQEATKEAIAQASGTGAPSASGTGISIPFPSPASH